jgi:uncharacterized protein with HEPN domain
MRSDAGRLNDILEAIAKIEERIPKDEETFERDEMLQVWVIHHLQVIGEAARWISDTLRSRRPDVPWAKIIALRNILVHEYFGLNMPQVWTMVQKDLPTLKAQIQSMQESLRPGSAEE